MDPDLLLRRDLRCGHIVQSVCATDCCTLSAYDNIVTHSVVVQTAHIGNTQRSPLLVTGELLVKLLNGMLV